MGRLSRGVGRAWRAVISVITLGLYKFSDPIERNPEVMGLEYDDIIHEKAEAAKRIKDAVGSLMGQQEACSRKIERLTDELEELEQEKAGAQALAAERVEQLKKDNVPFDQISADGEVLQYQGAFNDASTTIEEKKGRVADLEERIEGLQVSIDQHILQAQGIAREVERLKSEKHETIASVTAAKEIDAVNTALAGVSTSGADDRLAKLRERRDTAEGRAKAATRLAGTDVGLQRQKLRQAAQKHVHSKEFFQNIGLTESADKEAPAPKEPEKESDGKL